MSDARNAENNAGHAYTEYGVFADRASAGLGVLLVETTRDLERAKRLARRSPDAWGYPAEVKARRVYVTDWAAGLVVCADCGHEHTPDRCVGDPTPSDLWAGVTPASCDWPGPGPTAVTPPEMEEKR